MSTEPTPQDAPTETESCATCRAFDEKTRACRRHAPVVLAVVVFDDVKPVTLFPATTADQWCCEWIPQKVVQS